jgi:hypothetical protein
LPRKKSRVGTAVGPEMEMDGDVAVEAGGPRVTQKVPNPMSATATTISARVRRDLTC